MDDTIKDVPLKDFVEALNRNIRDGTNCDWVDDALKRFIVVDDKAILKRIQNDRTTHNNDR